MELRAIWKIFKRRWWIVAIPSLMAFVLAGYDFLTSGSAVTYTTSVRFTAATPPSAADGGYEDTEYYPWLTSEYVINGLTDWVRTGSFAVEVSEALAAQDIEIPAGSLQPAFGADNARSIMVLFINWGDADQIVSIAEAATRVLQESTAVYFPQLRSGSVEVIALDTPAVGAVPPSLSARLDPLIRLALGVAAGVALAALVEYLDPTIHTRGEAEALGIPILVEVPRFRRRR